MAKTGAQEALVIRETRHDWGWFVDLAAPAAPPDRGLSWSSVVDVPMRIGGAVVLAGGIGGVGTQDAHRRRGYSRRVLEACLALMQRERYGISFLHGIQDYYDKFGYITCMAEHELGVGAAEVLAASRAAGDVRLRALKGVDLPALARLYNRENERRTGSVPRDAKRFAGFGKGTWWTYKAGVRVAVDGRDRIVGYVVYDEVEQHCRASEVCGSSAVVCDAISLFLARRARRLGHERFWVFAPPDHPFGVYARRYGVQLNTLYPRNQKPMGRIIDLEVCLQRVAPELERRWGEHDRGLSLSLHTDVGTAILRWSGDRLRVATPSRPGKARAAKAAVHLGQRELMLLLMGYARPEDLLAWGAARIPRAARDLLARLFPLQEAHMWWTDRF